MVCTASIASSAATQSRYAVGFLHAARPHDSHTKGVGDPLESSASPPESPESAPDPLFVGSRLQFSTLVEQSPYATATAAKHVPGTRRCPHPSNMGSISTLLGIVGSDVGPLDGAEVGATVGAVDQGASLGEWRDGTTDGRAVDGSEVGAAVGDTDAVGAPVGAEDVGSVEGFAVGARDGMFDGRMVGSWVGSDVGALVGWKSHWTGEQHPFHCSWSIWVPLRLASGKQPRHRYSPSVSRSTCGRSWASARRHWVVPGTHGPVENGSATKKQLAPPNDPSVKNVTPRQRLGRWAHKRVQSSAKPTDAFIAIGRVWCSVLSSRVIRAIAGASWQLLLAPGSSSGSWPIATFV